MGHLFFVTLCILGFIFIKKIFNLGKLQRHEIPKKIWICSEPWTPDSGLLTEALKLKRKNIEKTFKNEIKNLYEKDP